MDNKQTDINQLLKLAARETESMPAEGIISFDRAFMSNLIQHLSLVLANAPQLGMASIPIRNMIIDIMPNFNLYPNTFQLLIMGFPPMKCMKCGLTDFSLHQHKAHWIAPGLCSECEAKTAPESKIVVMPGGKRNG